MLFQYYGGYFFQDAVYWLEQLGIRDVILPFFLIFTILFAVLQKTGVFGAITKTTTDSAGKKTREYDMAKAKKINALVALFISLLTVVPHVTGTYPPDADVIVLLNNALPQVALLAIVVVLFIMLLALGTEGKDMSSISSWVGGAAVIILGIIMYRVIFSTGSPSWLSFLDSPGFWPVIVILLAIGLAFHLVTKEST